MDISVRVNKLVLRVKRRMENLNTQLEESGKVIIPLNFYAFILFLWSPVFVEKKVFNKKIEYK